MIAIQKSKLRKNDKVIVITGKHKNKTGKIIRFLRKHNKVYVENINIVKRHTKPVIHKGQTIREGGLLDKTMPMAISNIAYLDPSNKPTRLGYRFENGEKVRYSKLSGKTLS